MTTPSFTAGTPASGTGNEGTSFVAPGAATQGGDPTEDKTVVFEHNGRKFTKADLTRKLDSADGFIEQLKAEGAQNREALAQANAALKEGINAVTLLKEIKQNGQQGQQGQQSGSEQQQQPPALTVDEIVTAVRKADVAATTEAQRKANWAEVTGTLTKAFGTAVDQKVAQVAADKGLTLEQAVEMARATPKVFLALFPDLSKQPGASPMPASGKVNSQAFNQSVKRESSGYTKASNTKDLVAIYQQRLNEVAGAAA